MSGDLVLAKLSSASKALATVTSAVQARGWAAMTKGAAVAAAKLKNAEATRYANGLHIRFVALEGEFLKNETKANGGQPYQKSTGSKKGPVETLADRKISKKESALAQKYAKLKRDDPKLFESAAEAGNEKAIRAAIKEANRQKRERAITKAAKAAPAASESYQLFHADCETADLSGVDWIITDPPYEKSAIDCYNKLARTAERTLKPGGSLLCMTGHSYLPEVITALCEYLTYHWTIAYLTPGGQAVQLFQRKVNTFWKPVLWFTKGEYRGPWIGDVTRSSVNDNDKRFHEWGQSESGMLDLMERFVRPGDTVFDPFMGAGTTGIVSLRLRARFVGYDLHEKAFNEAKVRMARAALD